MIASLLVLGIRHAAYGGSAGTPSAHVPAPHFVLGIIANGDEFRPKLAAASEGLFAKNGVDVTVMEVAPPALHSALAAGSVDGLSITADPAVMRIVEHLPYVVVAQAMERQGFLLPAGPGIHSLEDVAACKQGARAWLADGRHSPVNRNSPMEGNPSA